MNIKQLPKKKFSLPPPELTPPDKIIFHPLNALNGYRAVIIFAKYKEQWIYSRKKTRTVFEMPGGQTEPGETAPEAAKRELYEETGAVEYDIEPAFDFIGLMPHGEYWTGQTFYARVHRLGEMPDFEMAEVGLCDGVPIGTLYPDVTDALFRKMQTWLNLQSAKDELWDVYDANRVKTGRLHRRGEPLAPGDYHLGVLSILTKENSLPDLK